MQNCELLMESIDNLQTSVSLAQMHTLTPSILTLPEIREIKTLVHELYKNQISFKNEQNYYGYLFTEVKYLNSEILILIHFPITETMTLDLYHLIPIPIKNLTLIPEKPYLYLNATVHLYQEEPCHSIDEYCITHVEELLTPPDCIANLLQGRERNCTMTPIYVNIDLVSPVNAEYVVVIPRKTLEVRKMCDEAGFMDIHQPTLIRIPYQCKIDVIGDSFTNDQTEVAGSLFTLPQIPIIQPKSATQEVHVYKEIDLHHLTSIQRKINQLEVKPLQQGNITTTSIWTYIIIFILIVIIIYFVYRTVKCCKTKTNPYQFFIQFVKGKPSNNSQMKNQSISDENDVFP